MIKVKQYWSNYFTLAWGFNTHFKRLIMFVFTFLNVLWCSHSLILYENCKVFGLRPKIKAYPCSLARPHIPFVEWKFLGLDKLQLGVFSTRVEFPCRCEEKRHRTLCECYRRNTLTGSGVSCCRATLLGHSMHLFSLPLLSLFGLGHLTWLPERVTEGGRFAQWRAGQSASLIPGTYSR